MANHVLYDRIWESGKLEDCSRAAAMAYPWIFLVADDHGRFEYHPRRIWTKVFGRRADVTLEEVTAWLDEYWRVGLLIRYHIDGDLAHWYRFKGRKPSERRPSDLADPEGQPVLSYPGATRAEEGRREGDAGAEEGRNARDKSSPDIDQNGTDQERIGSEATYPQAAPALVPSDDRPFRPPNPLLGPGDVERLCLEGWRLVRAIEAKTGIGPETVITQASTGHGKFKGSPKARLEGMDHDRLILTVEDLRAWARRSGAVVEEAPPSPAQAVAAEPEWENLDAHIEAFVAWYRENPEAGTSGGKTGMHGVAFGAWARGKGLPEAVRDAVLRGGLKKLDALKRRTG